MSHQPVVSVTIFPLCGLSLSFPRQSRYPYQLMRGTILMRPDLLGTISCPLPSTIVLYKYRLQADPRISRVPGQLLGLCIVLLLPLSKLAAAPRSWTFNCQHPWSLALAIRLVNSKQELQSNMYHQKKARRPSSNWYRTALQIGVKECI